MSQCGKTFHRFDPCQEDRPVSGHADRPEPLLGAVIAQQLLLGCTHGASAVEQTAGDLLEYRRVRGRDVELPQLYLRARPGEIERALCVVRVVVTVCQLERSLDRIGHERRERDRGGGARCELHA